MTLEMGTTARHHNILQEIYWKVRTFLNNMPAHIFVEQLNLCYMGERKDLDSIELMDAKNTRLDDDTINRLYVVQPDIMLFHFNPFYTNKIETRFVGRTDLLIEVWSDSNSDRDKLFKKRLYSTSDTTEHWYIEQDSNDVECWLGQTQLPKQNLNDKLVTKAGIEIDLRHLAL